MSSRFQNKQALQIGTIGAPNKTSGVIRSYSYIQNEGHLPNLGYSVSLVLFGDIGWMPFTLRYQTISIPS